MKLWKESSWICWSEASWTRQSETPFPRHTKSQSCRESVVLEMRDSLLGSFLPCTTFWYRNSHSCQSSVRSVTSHLTLHQKTRTNLTQQTLSLFPSLSNAAQQQQQLTSLLSVSVHSTRHVDISFGFIGLLLHPYDSQIVSILGIIYAQIVTNQ